MFSRVIRQSTQAGRRFLSAAHAADHDAEHAAITATWKKRTFLAIPVVGALAVVNVFIHLSHGHHDHADRPHYHYEKKLLKKYPWQANECNLFDYHCKEEAYHKATGKTSKH